MGDGVAAQHASWATLQGVAEKIVLVLIQKQKHRNVYNSGRYRYWYRTTMSTSLTCWDIIVTFKRSQNEYSVHREHFIVVISSLHTLDFTVVVLNHLPPRATCVGTDDIFQPVRAAFPWAVDFRDVLPDLLTHSPNILKCTHFISILCICEILSSQILIPHRRDELFLVEPTFSTRFTVRIQLSSLMYCECNIALIKSKNFPQHIFLPVCEPAAAFVISELSQ